jgi:hypothetical protein
MKELGTVFVVVGALTQALAIIQPEDALFLTDGTLCVTYGALFNNFLF